MSRREIYPKAGGLEVFRMDGGGKFWLQSRAIGARLRQFQTLSGL
jgi:hypothetical protein